MKLARELCIVLTPSCSTWVSATAVLPWAPYARQVKTKAPGYRKLWAGITPQRSMRTALLVEVNGEMTRSICAMVYITHAAATNEIRYDVLVLASLGAMHHISDFV